MAVLVAALMMIATMVPAMVFAEPTTTYQITIDNAVKGETYSAYKIFDVTYTEAASAAPGTYSAATTIPGTADTRNEHKSYAYTIDDQSQWWNDLTTSIAGKNVVTSTPSVDPTSYTLSTFGLKFNKTTTDHIWNVVQDPADMTADQAAAFAAFLSEKVSGKQDSNHGTASAETTTTDDYKLGALTLNVGKDGSANDQYLGEGYYFVNTTTGSFCSLNTTEPVAIIREKNSIPSATKRVTDGETTTSHDNPGKTETSVKIGDTVTFTITVTNAKGTNQKIEIHDTMSQGLTLKKDTIALKVGETPVEKTNYTFKYLSTMANNGTAVNDSVTAVTSFSDSCNIEIELKEDYVKTLALGTQVVITYDAMLNEKASTDPASYETNKMTLKYASQTTHEEIVTVKTYEADIVKTDDANNILPGASFSLYPSSTGGTAIELVATETNGEYYIKGSTTGTAVTELTSTSGKFKIKGLEPGKYYLEEVNHPAGYYPLTERVEIEIISTNLNAVTAGTTYTSGGIKVENVPGKELPSTGGAGTTVLYIVGGMLVILAGAYLFFSRKKTA